jgi:gamma-glutamylcyclotransferase (GGCT)/AIG2-like uncharacterized protein YtfP
LASRHRAIGDPAIVFAALHHSVLLDAFLGLAARDWSALGAVVLAVGALIAAGWAAYTFRKAKRAEAARWMVALFRDFYRDETMSRARELIEYDFGDVAGPLLELRVLDRHVRLSELERSQLRDLDLVLNFLEQLIYLEEEGHLLDRDRNVFFEYWFDQLSKPTHAALRRYLRNCGYERCSDLLELEQSEFLVAYGSLLTGLGDETERELREGMESLGSCRLDGRLYSRGDFPALVPGSGSVQGELFRVGDKALFRQLDTLEHYDAGRRETSLYRRRCIRLPELEVDAWVYYWNKPVDDLREIGDGSWPRHLRTD